METITINGKEYNFAFNANTSELFYQVFGEDLTKITFDLKDNKMALMEKNRLPKLAYIANMQAEKSIRELSNRLNVGLYMEWLEQFPAGAFITDAEVIRAVQSGWINSCTATIKEVKNPTGQQ